MIGTRGRCLCKKSCLWENSNCQAARGISCELIFIFWSRSFIAIVTESEPKSRVHWFPSLETENILFFRKLADQIWAVDSRLKLKKWFEKWICCSTHQPIGNGYVYSVFGLILTFFGSIRMCLVVIGGETSLKSRWFFFFVVATLLFGKTMCTVLAKQHNCRFFVLETIQNVVAGFALFTVVETSRFIGWNVNTLFISTCWTIQISDSLSYFVVHTQIFLSTLG